MAGSIKWFLYTTDAGDTFAIKLDESNTELGGGGVDFPNAGTTIYALPSNVKPRTAYYVSADGLVTRKAVLCTNTSTPNTTIADPVSGLTLTLVRVDSERITFPRGEDTGLIDGDAT